ncbi:MAG TPA: hypothetical protein VLI41_16400 [Phenylobacterium sp.]|uniref:hypothetical protein n=1 Tax=Phenylobacterium sp. TaxID=1871053 RepID=UPI002C24F0DF|nr:hypothetical protein [Phenylobacterium sp.]HSV04778.1 hypothetical protein [Phenylobacterium sp.]
MGISMKGSVVGLAALGALALAAPAWAGCGDTAKLAPAVWSGSADPGAGLIRANVGASSIVGLWSVQFLAGGAMIDFGYAAWHSDGTEIMNSGGRAPSTENFCLGVWAQTGPFSYRLNHFALSYDPTSGTLNGRVNIKEDVVLDAKGASFEGPFTIDVYDPTGATLLQHVGGRIVGRRVTVN